MQFKKQESGNMLSSAVKQYVLAISETHLDSSFEDAEISIHGYNLFRSRYGGGAAVYI
jgi:hypothetical protein